MGHRGVVDRGRVRRVGYAGVCGDGLGRCTYLEIQCALGKGRRGRSVHLDAIRIAEVGAVWQKGRGSELFAEGRSGADAAEGQGEEGCTNP
jgi:hypothetical protein